MSTPQFKEPVGYCPEILANSIPVAVREFAQALVSSRQLPLPLEISDIKPEQSHSENQLRSASSQLDHHPGYEEWLHWMSYWISEFSALTAASAVDMTMSHSSKPNCPRFHSDYVSMRLICTLFGPGTQWLNHSDVARAKDGAIEQNYSTDVIQQLPESCVGLFPGNAYISEKDCGVVHRSPPDEVDRILVTLDVAQ